VTFSIDDMSFLAFTDSKPIILAFAILIAAQAIPFWWFGSSQKD
jgi:hypothetical protein